MRVLTRRSSPRVLTRRSWRVSVDGCVLFSHVVRPRGRMRSCSHTSFVAGFRGGMRSHTSFVAGFRGGMRSHTSFVAGPRGGMRSHTSFVAGPRGGMRAPDLVRSRSRIDYIKKLSVLSKFGLKHTNLC